MVLENVVENFVNKIEVSPEAIAKELNAIRLQGKGALQLENKWIQNQSKERLVELKSASKYAAIDSLYPRIDMSFLQHFTVEQGLLVLPKLAVFTPKQDVATLWYQTGWYAGLRCNVQSVLSYQNTETADCLKTLCGRRSLSRVIAKAYWGGRIPDASRAIIKAAQGQFDEVLIVAEVNEWQIIQKQNAILRIIFAAEKVVDSAAGNFLALIGDPLVIGRKGNTFWLVHEFDTTELEKYVGREFSM
jgi:hypothetical protein